jgi:hypothetical protein
MQNNTVVIYRNEVRESHTGECGAQTKIPNNILHANCYFTHNKNRLYYVLPSDSIVHLEKKSLFRDTSTQLSSGENIVSNLH